MTGIDLIQLVHTEVLVVHTEVLATKRDADQGHIEGT
jgi:hypothetical protein